MHVLAAPDKFRGTATAAEVAAAVAHAATQAGATATETPMADGGEGTLEVFGGPNQVSEVTGPLGRPVEAPWRLHRGTAVIEMARASGLALAGGAQSNDAMEATTFGTGQLIAEAARRGATRIIVGAGGSATTDGGLGALQALGSVHGLRGVELLVACDVRTRFTDAAEVFAPQKGASSAQVQMLRRRLERLVGVYAQEYGVDVSDMQSAGAAGGLAGGLACAGARLVDGFALLAEEVELDERIQEADLVVTGEGRFDAGSLQGKVVVGVCELAAATDVPVLVVVGQAAQDAAPVAGEMVSLAERYGFEPAMTRTLALIGQTVTDHLRKMQV